MYRYIKINVCLFETIWTRIFLVLKEFQVNKIKQNKLHFKGNRLTIISPMRYLPKIWNSHFFSCSFTPTVNLFIIKYLKLF